MPRRNQRISLRGAIAARGPDDHMVAQSYDRASARLSDHDIPKVDRGPVTSGQQGTVGRLKPEPADKEAGGQVHRSLYAKPETIELIRTLAFEQRVSAQHLYREGLLLMLQSRVLYKDKTIKDV